MTVMRLIYNSIPEIGSNNNEGISLYLANVMTIAMATNTIWCKAIEDHVRRLSTQLSFIIEDIY